jgi:hypothetical protein
MWMAVFAVGVSFFKGGNLTAGALVMAWIAGQIVYLITGDNLPVEFYLYPDVFVLAVIFAKPEWCNLRPYTSAWHQLKCIVLERSPADRIVMLIFPLMWVIYGAQISDFHRWWSLYFLCLVQLLAAGWESIILYRRDAEAADARQPDNTGTLLVACPQEVRFG